MGSIPQGLQGLVHITDAVDGCHRVCTGLHQQANKGQHRDALDAFGVDRIFEDIASGARDDRKGLVVVLDYIRRVTHS